MWEGDVVTHGALADFIAEEHHSAHVRRASRVYGERRSQLLAELSRLDDVLRSGALRCGPARVCTLP